VLPELCEPEFESMFLDEARIAARIHHPNVCEIFELVEHEGVLALSMEWVDGETLNTIINSRTNEPLDARVAAHIVAQAAAGLHAAHELKDENGLPMQLVHRDVSPQNILISRAGHVKVTDFGVAKALGDSREETAAGRVKGKLSYMSPEQAESKPLDRRSDVFALGVVLYLATVGVHPFRRANDNRDDQYVRLLVGEFRRPSSVIAGYPAELEAIVLRAMSHEPAERFATADEMRLRLQEWLVQSGPLLTEQHIARAMSERVGKTIEDRAERIQRCLRARRRTDKIDPFATGSELTFLPITSGHSMFSRSGVRSARLPRVLGVGAGFLLLGAILALSLTRGGDTPGAGSAEAASTARPASPATVSTPPAAPSGDEPIGTRLAPAEPIQPAKPSATPEHRGPLSLPEAMARALAERKERDARAGAKPRSNGSGAGDALRGEPARLRTSNGASPPTRATPSGSSAPSRSQPPAKLGPVEKDL
jgi:serine/threonine-protein kinase